MFIFLFKILEKYNKNIKSGIFLLHLCSDIPFNREFSTPLEENFHRGRKKGDKLPSLVTKLNFYAHLFIFGSTAMANQYAKSI